MPTELEDFRVEKDAFFKSHAQSPLTPAQQRVFKGLSYFDENPALRFEIEVEPFAQRDTVELQTSDGDVRAYQRFGRVTFEVDGQAAALTLYATPHGFFLPFVDSLAGEDTYPAGRYLDPEPLGSNRFLIDFNLAYNPYCAYGDGWSCPLPPAENVLGVAIEAGERAFARKG